MAQVMYYHRKYSTRKVLEDIPGYIYNRDEEASVETVPKGTVIDWGNMLDRYLSQQYTDEQARAVANLMLYCGVSVQMQYGPDNSGTSSEGIVPALVKYFGYNEYAVLKYRKDYDDEEWESMVYEELAKGNPLIYGGRTQKFTGHYFVLDGCDADGYVHVNWGWGGLDDGYFRLTSSDKMVLGGFSNYQEAIFDAVPDGAIQRLTTRNITLKSAATVEGLSSKATFPVSFTMTVANLNDSQNSFDLAVGLYKNGKLISMVDTLDCLYNFAVNNSKTVNASFNLDAKLAVGYYQLIPLSRKSGVENWHKNDNLDQFLAIGINNNKAEIFVGIPPVEGNIIEFADDDTKQICIKHWDKDGDGELTKWEAAAVTDLGTAFRINHEINVDFREENPYHPKYFNELQYFTGLTSIGNEAFMYSDSLKSVIMPPQLQSIGRDAFLGCYKLQAINIPESVTKIDDSAFEDCSSLTTIAILQGVTEIGSSAFWGCSSLVSVSLPNNLTKIGSSAFSGCSSLTSLIIPQGVKAIGNGAFYRCPLTSIRVEKGNTVYDSRENCNAIIETASNTIIMGCQNTVIPNSVTSIGESAFAGCTGLTSIRIPNNVTEIGLGILRLLQPLFHCHTTRGDSHRKWSV